VYVRLGFALGERFGAGPVGQAYHRPLRAGQSGYMRWFRRRLFVTFRNYSAGTGLGTW
jgi:hypothetical protein